MNNKVLLVLLAVVAVASASLATDCIYYHNQVRSGLGLPALTWSSSLASDSAAYASKLAKTSHLVHSTDRASNVGENLSMGTLNTYDTEKLIGLWTNEKRNFISGRKFPNISKTGNWKDVAHYSLMVWRTTTQVGCGTATNSKWRFMVCRYKRGGNISGQYPY